jgi:hypothetical protein
VRREATIVALLAVTGAATSVAAPAASAETRQFWVAAVPAPTWNMSPNERDAIHGMPLSPSQTVFPTVVYRRFTPHWGHPVRNIAAGTSNQDLIPGPLLRARAGDRLIVDSGRRSARPIQAAVQLPRLVGERLHVLSVHLVDVGGERTEVAGRDVHASPALSWGDLLRGLGNGQPTATVPVMKGWNEQM